MCHTFPVSSLVSVSFLDSVWGVIMAGGAVGEELSPQDERPSVLRRNASCFFFLRSGTAAGDKLLLLVPASSNFIIPTQHTLHPCSSVWYQTLSYLLWFLSLCGMNVGVMLRYLRGTSLLIQFDVRSKCRKINDKMYVKNLSTKYMSFWFTTKQKSEWFSLCWGRGARNKQTHCSHAGHWLALFLPRHVTEAGCSTSGVSAHLFRAVHSETCLHRQHGRWQKKTFISAALPFSSFSRKPTVEKHSASKGELEKKYVLPQACDVIYC